MPAPSDLRELLVIAVLRLAFPDRLIPASLDVAGLEGLRCRLDAGANVVTSLIAPNAGMTAVASLTRDIDTARRMPAAVNSVLARCGLAPAGRDEYRNWGAAAPPCGLFHEIQVRSHAGGGVRRKTSRGRGLLPGPQGRLAYPAGRPPGGTLGRRDLARPYIPDRVDEGYGLNKEALGNLYAQGKRLVITVDCGIRSLPEVSYASSIGLDLIISDHHHPASELPEAYAIINPKQPGDSYPYKDLAGVGLAYKLASALLSSYGTSPEDRLGVESYLDLVALGTVADLAPLTGENRALVKKGIEGIRRP